MILSTTTERTKQQRAKHFATQQVEEEMGNLRCGGIIDDADACMVLAPTGKGNLFFNFTVSFYVFVSFCLSSSPFNIFKIHQNLFIFFKKRFLRFLSHPLSMNARASVLFEKRERYHHLIFTSSSFRFVVSELHFLFHLLFIPTHDTKCRFWFSGSDVTRAWMSGLIGIASSSLSLQR